jgi:predicted ArsR family transcriptional regulator
MPGEPFDALAALGDPTRRALYEYVVEQGGWVGREQAADATGISRTLAAHHLDRLAAEGLLEVEFRRLGDRRGPGAGRPAKLYRRAARQFELSLPPRRYELAARVLADAVDSSQRDGVALAEALERGARRTGQAMADDVRAGGPGRSGRRALRLAIDAELKACGYEPEHDSAGSIALRNCPFHELARRHTDLVCGINLALLDGFVGSLPSARLAARFDPGEGRCCVRLEPASRS